MESYFWRYLSQDVYDGARVGVREIHPLLIYIKERRDTKSDILEQSFPIWCVFQICCISRARIPSLHSQPYWLGSVELEVQFIWRAVASAVTVTGFEGLGVTWRIKLCLFYFCASYATHVKNRQDFNHNLELVKVTGGPRWRKLCHKISSKISQHLFPSSFHSSFLVLQLFVLL